MRWFFFALVLSFVGHPASAEVLGLNCTFDRGAIGDIPLDGRIRIETTEGDLNLSFALERGEAAGVAQGNQDKVDVTTLWRGQIITILEPLITGTFHVTTVFGSSDGVWPATTSRHIANLNGEPFASQYYGLCQIKPVS